ncbi:MAG: flagellar hook-associated protein 2 [Halanaerobiales bacterium]|nr:flagellar hook-associated protein 2 [Halanaerobiales bacterium]
MGITLNGFSGLDIDKIINQIMWIERTPVRRLENRQDELNDQINAFRAVNTSLDTLKTKAKDLEEVFDQMSASSSDEEVVTATATSEAQSGIYEIEVTKLAQSHRVASARQSDSTSDLNLGADDTGGTFTISLAGGESFTVTVTGDDSLNDVMDAINNASGNDDGDGNKLVEASIIDNTLVIESANSGTSNELSFTDSNSVLQELDIVDATNIIQHELQQAQNAEFTVDSLTITRESNTIDDVIEGVTLQLEGKLNTKATLTVEADKEAMKKKIKAFVETYNALQDKLAQYTGKEAILQGDSTLRSIESRLYNSVVPALTTVSSEDWLPNNPLSAGGDLVITANGSTNTISFTGSESLEDIAKAIDGISGVTSYVEDNRIVIESNDNRPVDLTGSDSQVLKDLLLPGTFEKNAISLFGIEVDKNGKLSIDDEELDEALENNLSDVKQRFVGVNGVMDQVIEQVDLAIDNFEGYVTGRIDTLENEVDYLDEDIADLERQLAIREDNLRNQFTRMEQMIAQMQNQGNWLAAQIGSMGFWS